MHFRPDWEAVVTPVVDFALTQPEVNPDQIVLIGMSLGGYLAARAAAFEYRIAATVLYDGVYHVHSVFDEQRRVVAKLPGGVEDLMAQSVSVGWEARTGAGHSGLRTSTNWSGRLRPTQWTALRTRSRA
jgi:pimeloyl-ACP methyl ester carboxylesterase